MRRWVSLGGWCGPSLMLSKLGVRPAEEQLPFDMARCSLDGIVEFTMNGFAHGFFPGPLESRPFIPDPASIWLLFRAQHTCITHFDLNSDIVISEFQRRFAEWDAMITQPTRPVTFLRTCIAANPMDELNTLPLLHAAIRARSGGRLDFRTVMVLHNQSPVTERVADFPDEAAAGSPCVVWSIALDPSIPASQSLLDRCHDGYAHVIKEMSCDESWRERPARTLSSSLRPYNELCLVAGVPALRGSCTGFGTTHSAALGRCLYCGSTDGHAVAADAFDTKRPWTGTEDAALVEDFVSTGMDEVAAAEASALRLTRSANEARLRLRELVEG